MIKHHVLKGDCSVISYEMFFLIILISLLIPLIALLILIIFNTFEKQIYFLEVEKEHVMLEKELETAKYIELNQQIQPHFLFNALNSMYGLIRLREYDRLADSFEHMVLYLRSKYDSKRKVFPLKEEIKYTKHFIAIQQLRFGDRLNVYWDVEEGIEDVLVVPYLLQTLVENAFKHGIEKVEGKAVVKIVIKTVDDLLHIEVTDNGPGFSKNSLENNNGVGTGLSNVSQRLKFIFGEESKLMITLASESAHNGGKVTAILKKAYDEIELEDDSIN